MLDSQHEELTGVAPSASPTLSEALATLPRGLDLPDREAFDQQRRGPLPAHPKDVRQYPRFHYATEAVLGSRQTLPALPRPTREYVILAHNISRGGIGFLHEQQLFPGERASLWLPGEQRHEVVVERCRKLNQRCYEVGGRILPNDQMVAGDADADCHPQTTQ